MSRVLVPTVRRGVTLLAVAALASPATASVAHPLPRSPVTAAAVADAARLAAAHASLADVAVPLGLRFHQQRVSLLGTHRWYQQVEHGHVVVGGWYAVHLWNDGSAQANEPFMM